MFQARGVAGHDWLRWIWFHWDWTHLNIAQDLNYSFLSLKRGLNGFFFLFLFFVEGMNEDDAYQNCLICLLGDSVDVIILIHILYYCFFAWLFI